MKQLLTRNFQLFFMLFCLIIGFFLRAYNLNWDQWLTFHPDERNIDIAVTNIRFFSQLNPHFFAYGGFSIYLYRAVGELLSIITKSNTWVTDWGHINLIGRFFSALISTITVIPLYFLAKKLFGKKTAILSSLLYIFTVTSIQHAHFATTESTLTFFGILLCLASLIWYEKPTTVKSIFLGIVFGVSLATKTSAFLTILFPFTALMLIVLSQYKQSKKLIPLIPQILIFLSFSAILAFSFSPYSIIDSKDFAASMQYESGVAIGSISVPYTLQFMGSIPYLFQTENFIWQMGPLLAIFGVLGMLFIILKPFRKIERRWFIFWIFPLVYFLYVGSWHAKFLRYMVPIIPFFIIAASFFLIFVLQKYKKLGTLLIFLTITTTYFWSCAFLSIYMCPQTRIVATEWINTHIPQGSVIAGEAEDDQLPIFSNKPYGHIILDMYALDSPTKIQNLAKELSHIDYIAFNSRRVYGTLGRLNQEYPITSHYYRLLFAGKLGYKQVTEFTSYPQFLGITINDDASEETFQVFDHPKVIIFKNAKHFSVAHLETLLH